MQAADVEGTEALPGAATEAQFQRRFGHALVAMRARHGAGQAGADAAVGVVDQEAVFAAALVLDGFGQQAVHLRGQAVR
ncbi:hypothetical protein D3C71_1362570 [compost metagenome]